MMAMPTGSVITPTTTPTMPAAMCGSTFLTEKDASRTYFWTTSSQCLRRLASAWSCGTDEGVLHLPNP